MRTPSTASFAAVAVLCAGSQQQILSTIQATFDGQVRDLHWVVGMQPQEVADEYCRRFIMRPQPSQVRFQQLTYLRFHRPLVNMFAGRLNSARTKSRTRFWIVWKASCEIWFPTGKCAKRLTISYSKIGTKVQ
jgi:hypothetical protein